MIEEYLGTKPFFDRSLASLVDQKDCMYVYNDFVQPGYHNYYIIVPNGIGGYIYKKHFLTFVKPRTEDIPHKQLPVALTEEELPPEVYIQESVVGKSWTFESS